MRLVERLGRSFGHLNPKEQKARRDRHTRIEEDQARNLVCIMYATGEMNLTTPLAQMQQSVRQDQDVYPLIRDRVKHGAALLRSSTSDSSLTEGVNRFLALVDPAHGPDIEIGGLQEAEDFWEQELARPDLETDQIKYGRERLTRIKERLSQFQPKPPERQG